MKECHYILWRLITFAGILIILIACALLALFRILPKSGTINAVINGEAFLNEASIEGTIQTKTLTVELGNVESSAINGYIYINGTEVIKDTEKDFDVRKSKSPVVLTILSDTELRIRSTMRMPLDIQENCIICNSIDNEWEIEIAGSDFTVLVEDGLFLYDEKETKEIKIKNGTVALHNGVMPVSKYSALKVKWDGHNEDMRYEGASAIAAVGEGRMSLYNSARLQAYDFRGNISISSDNIQTRIKDGTIEIQGETSDAQIMGYSIFPSFFGWIVENAYAIPASLLTIFGGAITLTVNSMDRLYKNKQKEAEKKAETEKEKAKEEVSERKTPPNNCGTTKATTEGEK